MPWIRRNLRGNTVFVRTDERGAPVTGDDGRVDILYKLQPGAKVYRAALRNLEPTGNPADERPIEAAEDPLAAPVTTSGEPPDDAIIIYTDGACTGNPGPMGIGAVVIDGDVRHEISEYLGEGTNNIAELTAILRALELIPDDHRHRTVVLHSDSSYSLGLLTKDWKAKKNVELVAELRELVREFSDLRFVKVKGHAGVPENERADVLATSAIADRDADC